MDYQNTLEYLYDKLPMFQRTGKTAFKKDLTNALKILDMMDNPHKSIKCVHVAGTNGKGTSSHALASVFSLHGYKTGLYTSPHLKEFTERIKVNNVEIPKEEVVSFVNKYKEMIERVNPSFFELTVCMAFYYFHKQKVDIAIIETGLGGRMDSTNVITPEISLITNISLDHCDLLGDTLPKIANEKAGIIKPNVPVVLGSYQSEVINVFVQKARKTNSKLLLPTDKYKEEIHALLLPEYIKDNMPGVLTVCDALQTKWALSRAIIFKALHSFIETTGLKGRYQTLRDNPLVIADVSHNVAGLDKLIRQISIEWKCRKGVLHIVFGTVKDKSSNSILAILPKEATYYFTQTQTPRAFPVDILFEFAREQGLKGEKYQEVNMATQEALKQANPRDIILITGSTFIVAELKIKKVYKKMNR